MPIYEYKCNACQLRFERRQRFHDKPLARCPKCGGEAHRVIHPAPAIFRGKGFYTTDSRKVIPEKKTPDKGKPK